MRVGELVPRSVRGERQSRSTQHEPSLVGAGSRKVRSTGTDMYLHVEALYLDIVTVCCAVVHF